MSLFIIIPYNKLLFIFYMNYSLCFRIFIYVCSAKLALKMKLTKEQTQNLDEIIFKDYFNGLNSDEAKNCIRDLFVLRYNMGYTTFYRKVRENSFSELEFEKLEEITKLKFTRPCSDQ